MTVLAATIQDSVANAWTGIASFAVRFAGALLILLAGVVVARVLARATRKALDRAGFNRAVDRGGIRRFLAHTRYEPAQVLGKLVFWVVLLCTLQLALEVFGPNPLSGLLAGLVAYIPRVFAAIVVLVVAVALGRFVRDGLRGALRLTPFGHQLASAAGIAIVTAGCFIALDQLAIAPAIVAALWYAALVAVVGSVVIAFGVGGIPVARRYLERAADDLDGRLAKLREVKAAERAAARANRPPVPQAMGAAAEQAGGRPGRGLEQPTGYPHEPAVASYDAERPAAPYAAGGGLPDAGRYGQPPSQPPGADGQFRGHGYDATLPGPDDLTQPDLTRRYGGSAPAPSGAYAPEQQGGGTRPPGEQHRHEARAQAGQAPPQPGQPAAKGDPPRGVPRPFDDRLPRYGRAEPGKDGDNDNGFGPTYPYPR